MKNKDAQRYWDNQAKVYGISSLATSPDTIAFNMEIDSIKKYIKDGDTILDIGCGNGCKAIAIGADIECSYLGIDYSEEMIRQAYMALDEYNKTGGGI